MSNRTKTPDAQPAETANETPRPVAYVVRMRPTLAAQISGKAFAKVPRPVLPAPLAPSDRLYLVEFAGARTGRSDLVSVVNSDLPGVLTVRRGIGWRREAPETVESLGYRTVVVDGPLLEALSPVDASAYVWEPVL